MVNPWYINLFPCSLKKKAWHIFIKDIAELPSRSRKTSVRFLPSSDQDFKCNFSAMEIKLESLLVGFLGKALWDASTC